MGSGVQGWAQVLAVGVGVKGVGVGVQGVGTGSQWDYGGLG